MKPGCFSLALALAGIAAAVALAGGLGAEEGGKADVGAVVEAVATKLLTAKEGVRVGMPMDELEKAAKGAARVVDTFDIPLKKTGFAIEGLDGIVECSFIGEETVVGEVRVLVLVGDYDRKAVLERAMKVGKKHGLEMTEDDEVPNSCFGYGKIGRDRWVGLGEGIITISSGPD
jgi:hypothetical protein